MIHIVVVTMTTYSANIRWVTCAVCRIVYGDDGLPGTKHFYFVSSRSTPVTNIRRHVRQLVSQRSYAGRSTRCALLVYS